jgi:hypothetical protein
MPVIERQKYLTIIGNQKDSVKELEILRTEKSVEIENVYGTKSEHRPKIQLKSRVPINIAKVSVKPDLSRTIM